MKTISQFIFILMSLLLLLSSNSVLISEELPDYLKNIPSVEYMLSNANMGNEFYLAIPQNDIKTGQREDIIAVYICSFTDTKVTIRNEYFPFERTKTVKAFEPTFFSSKAGDLSFAWEVDKSEEVTTNCFRLTSDDPIAVMVLNSREASSDSYLAIPTSAWGKKYVHCAYYDHNEGFPSNIRRGGGFIVVSAHDGTSVTITLKGKGEDLGQTVGEHKIGDIINVSLRKGEAYMIRGDASTDRGFDISGSIIEATNPVGVISFHQRTMIPNQCPNGRDHLNEMLIPVQSWGTDFVTMEFDRNGQGDFFRVVAIEDNTVLTADQYSPGSGNLLPDGHISTTLKKGEFWEYLQSTCSNNNKQNGVRGVTIWHSTKPVMVMQYAYSYPWDGDRNWDPLMIIVPPISQFQNSVVFQTPVETDFHTHQITFFAIDNPNDPKRKLLNSIYFDGEKLADKYPQFLYNRIPNTNIFWGRLDIVSGTHYITSDTKISGYLTGFSGYNSYGNPFIVGTNKIDELDTLPPEFVYYDDNCGVYNYTVFESRNALNDPIPQKDQGIKSIYLIKELSNNFSYQLVKPEKFKPELKINEQKLIIQVENLDSNAKAFFILNDRAGNSTIDSIIYIAPKVQLTSEIDFKNTRLNSTKVEYQSITNYGEIPIIINDIKLKKQEVFNLTILDTLEFPYTFLPGDTIHLKLSYSPNININNIDSLIVTSECKIYKTVLKGIGVAPKISVADWNAGSIEVGRKICFEEMQGEGLRISNDGTDTLTIFGISNLEAPFSVENPKPQFPFKLAPAEITYFSSICFEPKDTGTYKSELIFQSDKLEGDSIATLTGKAYIKVSVENNNYETNSLQLSPNPVVNGILYLNVTNSTNSNAIFEIYNSNGIKLFEQKFSDLKQGNNKINIDINHLPSGLYLLSATFDNVKIITRKFIKLQ